MTDEAKPYKWEQDARANNAEAAVQFERARALAAEAQRDRLAAEVQMLGQGVHDTWHKGSTFGDCEEATCGLARAIVRAALADVPEGVMRLRPDGVTWRDDRNASPTAPYTADRQRRRDAAYAAMREALTALYEREGPRNEKGMVVAAADIAAMPLEQFLEVWDFRGRVAMRDAALALALARQAED